MASAADVLEIVVTSMRDAFLAVTVFVAAMVLLFSWLQYVTSGRFVEYIQEHKKLQPIIGALMGLTPGCGGAIVMMPMYARGYVSYGTVVATLIATLGDSAFVLIGAAVADSRFVAPLIAVHVLSFCVGVHGGISLTSRAPPLGNHLVNLGPPLVEMNPHLPQKRLLLLWMIFHGKCLKDSATRFSTRATCYGGLSQVWA